MPKAERHNKGISDERHTIKCLLPEILQGIPRHTQITIFSCFHNDNIPVEVTVTLVVAYPVITTYSHSH